VPRFTTWLVGIELATSLIVKTFLLLLPLTACGTPSPDTSPGSLPALSAHGPVTITVHADTGQDYPTANHFLRAVLSFGDEAATDCPYLATAVTATFDGDPMEIARGGADLFGHGCIDVSMAQAFDPPRPGASELTLTDRSTTWTITAPDLFANDFARDPADPSRVIWKSVDQINNGDIRYVGSAELNQVATQGNTLIGTQPAEAAYAESIAPATGCSGPDVCVTDRLGYSELGTP
jgi:hypothetical protein